MAIAIPNLDDRTYADLVAETRALIPVYDPGWTNHNPSDPGITLLELFAWLVEMQIYGLDQITDEHRVAFLRLLSGPDLEAVRAPDGAIDKGWLDANTATIVQSMRQITRAVSAADYETLALAVPGVQRARCAPRRNLDIDGAAAAQALAPGHVSLVILQADPKASDGQVDSLCASVRAALEPARMLTTRLHVVAPTWAPLRSHVVVARCADRRPEPLAAQVARGLTEWLDAWTGADGAGWPFGRNVYVSEMTAVLARISGVDHVGDVGLDSEAPPGAARQQTALPIWNDDGAQIGLAIGDPHLPLCVPASHRIVVADALQPLGVKVAVTPSRRAGPVATRRIVMRALREFLWSLQWQAYSSGDGAQRLSLSQGAVLTALDDNAEVREVATSYVVVIEADPTNFNPKTSAYEFPAGVYFSTDCRVEIEGGAS